ncbi:hypothetical protein AB4212_68415, partial [Streptomyces sp. 2MCAF27]
MEDGVQGGGRGLAGEWIVALDGVEQGRAQRPQMRGGRRISSLEEFRGHVAGRAGDAVAGQA